MFLVWKCCISFLFYFSLCNWPTVLIQPPSGPVHHTHGLNAATQAWSDLHMGEKPAFQDPISARINYEKYRTLLIILWFIVTRVWLWNIREEGETLEARRDIWLCLSSPSLPLSMHERRMIIAQDASSPGDAPCVNMCVPSRFPGTLLPHSTTTSPQCHLGGGRPFQTALSELHSSYHSQPSIPQPKSNCHHTHTHTLVVTCLGQTKPIFHCHSLIHTCPHTLPLSLKHTRKHQWNKQKGPFVISAEVSWMHCDGHLLIHCHSPRGNAVQWSCCFCWASAYHPSQSTCHYPSSSLGATGKERQSELLPQKNIQITK